VRIFVVTLSAVQLVWQQQQQQQQRSHPYKWLCMMIKSSAALAQISAINVQFTA
jgi:hypothetical protein